MASGVRGARPIQNGNGTLPRLSSEGSANKKQRGTEGPVIKAIHKHPLLPLK